MNCIILAPGHSLTGEIAERCRGQGYVIAVNDAYTLAPWCDAIVANDRAWWTNRPQVMSMPCRKFSTSPIGGSVERIEKHASQISSGSNSGLVGLHVAVTILGAANVALVGFDMGGDHFFGKHELPLKNTAASRYAVFCLQFEQMAHIYRARGARIVNCTIGSALKTYPIVDLDSELDSWKSRLAA